MPSLTDTIHHRPDPALRRVAILAVVVVSVSIVAGLGLLVGRRIARPASGKLVAPHPLAVWKSPPIRDGAPRLKAEAKYKLVNRGRGVVRVVSVESGCGCTVVNVEPKLIEPDAMTEVTAIGTPLSSGERTVPITIHTDSPLSPEIILHFKMITDRVPPFILQVSGDFAYPEEIPRDDVRELVVSTVESGPPDQAPIVRSDLPFLSVSLPTVREFPYDETSLRRRTYVYRVTFNAKPKDESFTGRIWVVDPWSGSKAGELLVIHRAKRTIKVVPSIVSIDVGTHRSRRPGRAEVTVLTPHPMPQLVVEPWGDGSEGLEIREITPQDASRFRRFVVTANAGEVNGSERWAIRIKERPDAEDSLMIPVVVRRASP